MLRFDKVYIILSSKIFCCTLEKPKKLFFFLRDTLLSCFILFNQEKNKVKNYIFFITLEIGIYFPVFFNFSIL